MMKPQLRELEDRRGLRFPFDATADVLTDCSSQPVSSRVTELSFRGCFLELSATLQPQQHLRVKIFHVNEFFEAAAHVLYVKPNGAGIVFLEMQPHFRAVLQNWILAALDHNKATHS